MTTKRRCWCPGKVCYPSAELAERSRRGIVYRDAIRERLKPGGASPRRLLVRGMSIISSWS